MLEHQQQAAQSDQDTEITLGTGKLLVMFFIAAAVCGAFFGMGYSVGKNSTPLNPMNSSPLGVSVSSNGSKPGAGTVAKPLPPDCASTPAGCSQAQTGSLSASVAPAAATDPTPQPVNSTAPSNSSVDPSVGNSPANPATPELNGKSNLMVQVAAVTKQEDAEALVSALRRKNYPVFVVPNSGPDRLFHVQVGPFAESKDAEAMKSKLVGDGYNAIVKK